MKLESYHWKFDNVVVFTCFFFSQNADPDSVYIVLNGRLRAVQKNEAGKKTLGDEYGRGEFVGLVSTVLPRLSVLIPQTNNNNKHQSFNLQK